MGNNFNTETVTSLGFINSHPDNLTDVDYLNKLTEPFFEHNSLLKY